MTDAAETAARLANEAAAEMGLPCAWGAVDCEDDGYSSLVAFRRYIERTEAEREKFAREVSDRVEAFKADMGWDWDTLHRESFSKHLAPLILPEPVDPLEQAISDALPIGIMDSRDHSAAVADILSAVRAHPEQQP